MEPVEVKLPVHSDCLMTPLKDDRRGDCCGIKFEDISDGYYCSDCDFFVHKTCSNSPESINHHPSHKCGKPLNIRETYDFPSQRCGLCGEGTLSNASCYNCSTCGMKIHLECGKLPPPEVIDVPQNHNHKLKLEMVERFFTCAACGKDGDGYSYKCHDCDLTFHVNCGKYGAEVNHPSHSLHSLKLFKGEPPTYTGGECRLCAKKIVDEAFYHCSTCNFTLDMHCVFHPPPLYLDDLNVHDHQLTLMPKSISFSCTICGLNGDRSPYVCLLCDFTAHNDCSGFPWVININRHDHRVSRISLLGVATSVCGVCQKKMNWSCGGYSCKRCPNSVYHTKCATRRDVWDGKEMKGKPGEDEDVKPFKVIYGSIINHSHHCHNLRLDRSGNFVEERSCDACAYPIYHHHCFYSCMECDFMLHEICAKLPNGKRNVLSNSKYKLRKLYATTDNASRCEACAVYYNGFTYESDENSLDVRCASVTEPFDHQSHPHPLYYTTPKGVCSACNKVAHHVLKCVEDDCGYVLDFHCALLPYKVKHRVDDHFLSLCYGEKASGKYWCDICEKETDPNTWFYTCEECGVTLHIKCVLGDFRGLKPGSEVYNGHFCFVVRNNSMSRPICFECKCRCISPVILKGRSDNSLLPNEYCCSENCWKSEFLTTATRTTARSDFGGFFLSRIPKYVVFGGVLLFLVSFFFFLKNLH